MEDKYELVKHFEGLHDGDLTKIGLQPKLCPAGVWTIGWGHAATDENGRQLKGDAGKAKAYELYPTLTIEQADELLLKDYAAYEGSVKALLKIRPTYGQLSAMTDLCYNIGRTNFTTSDVLKFFNRNMLQQAADSFMNWKSIIDPKTGKLEPVKGLILRRKTEQNYFLTGKLTYFN